MFPEENPRDPAKFLIVRAPKKHSEQRHFNKMIKLDLVDHSCEYGIPYKKYVDDDAGKFAKDDDEKKADKKTRTSSANKSQATSSIVGAKKGKSRGRSCCNCDYIRSIVSTNKKRLDTGEFNLDLTYITNRIIACGFPAEGFESIYRNKKSDIVAFL